MRAGDPAAVPVGPQPAYEDPLIDGGNLVADVTFGDAGLMNSSGWSRSLRAEGITSRVSRDGVDQDEPACA